MDSFSSIGITSANETEKKKFKKKMEHIKMHGVDKIMERSTQKSSNSEGVSGGSAPLSVHMFLF